MNLKLAFGVFAVGLMLMAPAVPVAAVHGSPYLARGIAYVSAMPLPDVSPYFAPVGVPASPDQTFLATVRWNGGWPGTYTVTISNGASNIVQQTFPGIETWPNGPGNGIYNNQEFLWYHGYDLSASVNFEVEGFQSSNLQTQQQWMAYTGHYNQYTLVLVVDDRVNDVLGN